MPNAGSQSHEIHILTDDEADEIRRELASGLRGPILIKWVEQLLADRDERRALEMEQPPQPGPQADEVLERLVEGRRRVEAGRRD